MVWKEKIQDGVFKLFKFFKFFLIFESFVNFIFLKTRKKECTPSGTNTERSNKALRKEASCEPINDITEVPRFEYNYPASNTDYTKADKSAVKIKASEASHKANKAGSSIASKGSRGGSSIGSKGKSTTATTNLMSKDWKKSDSSVYLKDCDMLSCTGNDDMRNLILESILDKD